MRSVKKKVTSMILVATMILSLSACGKDKSTTEVTTTEATTEATTTEEQPSEAELAAEEIIANAESYEADDKKFSELEYYDNPEIYYLEEQHEDGYEIILGDLDDKTDSSRNQLMDLYKNIDKMFSVEDENTKGVFNYYRYMTTDKETADVYMYENTGKSFASGEEIYGWEVTFYVPYYLRESLYSDKELTLEAVLAEMETLNINESLFSDIENHSDDYGQYVPFVENIAFFGAVYEEFVGISEHELVFSSPITVEEYQHYEWFDGAEDCTYLIPFYDKTADIYGLSGYNKDNELVKVEFDYEGATHSESTSEKEEGSADAPSTSANSQPNTTQVADNSTSNNENTTESTTDNNTTSTNTTTAPSTTTTSTGGTSQGTGSAVVGDDGITFVIVHEHTWERQVVKRSDAYENEEITGWRYECSYCGSACADDINCPNCGDQSYINSEPIFETVTVPATYEEYYLCTSCGSITGNRLFEE